MLKLKLSPKAINDLEEVYEYTLSNWGTKQAEKYQDELFEQMTRIAHDSQIGSTYLFSKGNYQKFKINKHLIFYRIENEDLVVVRILHERMDFKSRL